MTQTLEYTLDSHSAEVAAMRKYGGGHAPPSLLEPADSFNPGLRARYGKGRVLFKRRLVETSRLLKRAWGGRVQWTE